MADASGYQFLVTSYAQLTGQESNVSVEEHKLTWQSPNHVAQSRANNKIDVAPSAWLSLKFDDNRFSLCINNRATTTLFPRQEQQIKRKHLTIKDNQPSKEIPLIHKPPSTPAICFSFIGNVLPSWRCCCCQYDMSAQFMAPHWFPAHPLWPHPLVLWPVLQLIYTFVRVFNEINRRILIDLLVNAAFNWASI